MILLKNVKSEARKIKNKKGTIWNLEKVSSNHIEIKSIGSVAYHRERTKYLMSLSSMPIILRRFLKTLILNTEKD